MKGEYHLDHW